MKLKRILLAPIIALLFAPFPTLASEDHSAALERAENLITAEALCDELSEEEFEALGEYFMEQMHPGEQHGVMDRMMGEEGSEGLKVAHINMGRAFYCRDQVMGAGMMGGGMMGNIDNIRDSKDFVQQKSFNMMGSGFEPIGYGGILSGFSQSSTFSWVTWVLIIALLVLGNIRLWQLIIKNSRHKK
jgi:hypothetical protein